jgi:hypothetical protein
MTASGLVDVLQPFLRLALAAFIAGFLCYVGLHGAAASAKPEQQFAPRVSAPTGDDWNLPKRI